MAEGKRTRNGRAGPRLFVRPHVLAIPNECVLDVPFCSPPLDLRVSAAQGRATLRGPGKFTSSEKKKKKKKNGITDKRSSSCLLSNARSVQMVRENRVREEQLLCHFLLPKISWDRGKYRLTRTRIETFVGKRKKRTRDGREISKR